MARSSMPAIAAWNKAPTAGRLCVHREVAADGRIVCRKIVRGDPGITPDLCARCPAAEIGCRHLRFSLRQESCPPIRIYYSSGRSEVLEAEPPALSFVRAGCEVYVRAVPGVETCLSCPERAAVGRRAARAKDGNLGGETKVVPLSQARVAGG
jgi:hypothetical protein